MTEVDPEVAGVWAWYDAERPPFLPNYFNSHLFSPLMDPINDYVHVHDASPAKNCIHLVVVSRMLRR